MAVRSYFETVATAKAAGVAGKCAFVAEKLSNVVPKSSQVSREARDWAQNPLFVVTVMPSNYLVIRVLPSNVANAVSGRLLMSKPSRDR